MKKILVWLAWETHFSVGFFSKQILLRRDFLKAIDTKATGKEILVAILYSIKLNNLFKKKEKQTYFGPYLSYTFLKSNHHFGLKPHILFNYHCDYSTIVIIRRFLEIF